jgi:hypothetical protein
VNPEHLYSFPWERPRLNREYVPHIAAHSRAVLELGYETAAPAFQSIVDLVATSYETGFYPKNPRRASNEEGQQ